MKFETEPIPEPLKERDQWICWTEKERNGKLTKIPKQPGGSGKNAKANDIATWGTFEDAVETAENRDWGIGYVFNEAGPYAGLDLDDCFRSGDPNRPADWLPDLSEFVEETYIERSPSGDGMHIIVEGEVPEWWTNQERETEDGSHEGVEMYDTGRFFTFTGYEMDISGGSVSRIDALTDWLLDVYEQFTGGLPTVPTGRDGDELDFELSVYDIIPAARYPADERKSHPYHDSSTGSNFHVDEGGETWRCWRHGVTGGAAHLLGIEQGIIECGDWKSGGVSSDTWHEIFDAAREDGYDIPEPDTGPEQPPEMEEVDDDEWPVEERIEEVVLNALNPGEESERQSISQDEAIERTAHIFADEWNFVRPREDTRGWRDTLYIYSDEDGIYEPHGDTFVQRKAERMWGEFSTNQRIRELVGKLERMSRVGKRRLTSHAERLVVANGILDLTEGELDDHSPDEYHKTMVDVEYHADAECPRIDDFLHDIVDDGDVPTLYRLVAHTLYKEYAAEKAAMLLGEGQNGKSVFLSLVERFLGQYNVSNQSLQDLNEDNWAANNLVGKLANVHPDMSDQNVNTMDTFKKLTGRDTISADVKFEEPVQFENYATLIFAANRMPILKDDTRGNWRRWILIDFPNTFERGADDWQPKHELMAELTTAEELQGLLARAVEEIQAWADGREWFPSAPSWEETRQRIRRAAEPVYDFAHACLRDQDDGFVEAEKLRTVYQRYAEEEGLPKMTPETFGQKLLNVADLTVEKGQKRQNGRRVTGYKNVMLTQRGEQLANNVTPEDGRQSAFKGPRGRKDKIVELTREAIDENGDEAVHRQYVLGKATQVGMERDEAKHAIQKALNQNDLIRTGERLEPV